MLLRMVYEERLAQAAYLIGCQRSGEAIIIDPLRDVDTYQRLAAAHGLRLVAAAETHIHADFVSGARELAEQGAHIYVSAEGGPDWQSRWLDQKSSGGSYAATRLWNGDTFRIGGVEFKVLHTPGHTPEHICYLVTDRGGGASEPMGLLTGDFVFVGDLGRPDLLEVAAGQAGSARPAAAALRRSLGRFLELPDYLQVWPAHGAGSACGKALGAVPQSTVGYERRFNPAVLAAATEERFAGHILEGQPEPPLYFARMKRVNRDGPRVLGSIPRLERIGTGLPAGGDVEIVDTRPWAEFRAGHLPGSLCIPLDPLFPAIAGSYIHPEAEVVIVAEEARVDAIVRALLRVGIDRSAGFIEPGSLRKFAPGGTLAQTEELSPAEAQVRLRQGASSLDVRRADEFADGHIPGARRAVHTRLPALLEGLPKDRPVLVNCRSGVRSARAAALLERRGYRAINLAGGFLAWQASGAPIEA
jgi:hydroxyacylglutathione hydrolase